jgi:hypothetical protein
MSDACGQLHPLIERFATHVVDETVLRRVVLRLQRPEESLLRSENLHRRGRVLGKVHQATSVADESRTDQLADQRRQVGSNGLHSVPQVVGQLRSVLGDGDDLVAERVDVAHVGIGDFGTHRQLGGSLDGCLEVFGEDELERGGRGVSSEACE